VGKAIGRDMYKLVNEYKNKLIILALGVSALLAPQYGRATSAYDSIVLNAKPVAYFTLANHHGIETDKSGRGHVGTYKPTGQHAGTALMPNGDTCTGFDGASQYFEISNSSDLSIPQTGVLTIEAWIRPDVLEFPHTQGSGYVYWLGKGAAQQYEYGGRMYSFTNSETPPRPNRISGYAFNLSGGLGSGSYFQDSVSTGEWIYVTIIFNTTKTSQAAPTGYVKIYRNGNLRRSTSLNQFDVIPGFGAEPLRIATMSMQSYFDGAIGKVAIYNYELSSTQIKLHYRRMVDPHHY
jgi:hypothetical protein